MDMDYTQLKMVAGQLCVDWGRDQTNNGNDNDRESSRIARRIVDFQFAKQKRRKKFGNERPWEILGLYDHLSAVRSDIEWAEIAACCRANGEP